MKKTAFGLISLVVFFSTLVVSLLCSSVNGNPGWRPWENEISYPTLDVDSPVAAGNYSSNDVWLNFTLTKPSDWFTKPDCYISYVTYCVDGSATGPNGRISDNSDENETIISVQDKGIENPPTSFSFSFNLEGLTAGTHTLEILAEGHYDWTGFGYTYPRTYFTVYTSSPASTPTSTPEPIPTSSPYIALQLAEQEAISGVALTVAVLAVGLGLLVYKIKRK